MITRSAPTQPESGGKPVRPDEIVVGGVYEGPDERVERFARITNVTAEFVRYQEFGNPCRETCVLETFARWAKRRIDTEETQ